MHSERRSPIGQAQKRCTTVCSFYCSQSAQPVNPKKSTPVVICGKSPIFARGKLALRRHKQSILQCCTSMQSTRWHSPGHSRFLSADYGAHQPHFKAWSYWHPRLHDTTTRKVSRNLSKVEDIANTWDTGDNCFCTVSGQLYDHHPCRHLISELHQPTAEP